jgi:hypothetical protein
MRSPRDSFLVANAAYVAKMTGSAAAEVVLIHAAVDPARLRGHGYPSDGRKSRLVEGGHVTNSRKQAAARGRRAEATQLPAKQPGTKAHYDAISTPAIASLLYA